MALPELSDAFPGIAASQHPLRIIPVRKKMRFWRANENYSSCFNIVRDISRILPAARSKRSRYAGVAARRSAPTACSYSGHDGRIATCADRAFPIADPGRGGRSCNTAPRYHAQQVCRSRGKSTAYDDGSSKTTNGFRLGHPSGQSNEGDPAQADGTEGHPRYSSCGSAIVPDSRGRSLGSTSKRADKAGGVAGEDRGPRPEFGETEWRSLQAGAFRQRLSFLSLFAVGARLSFPKMSATSGPRVQWVERAGRRSRSAGG